MNFKKLIKRSLLVIIFFVGSSYFEVIIAQPPPPTPKEIPLDGGLGALLLAGAAYAAKKMHKNKACK